jgi:mRNA-degrading endonuclease toxin of MazEF toxin-antitoxin module
MEEELIPKLYSPYSHDIKRGDIFYVNELDNTTGKPALIISDNEINFNTPKCVILHLSKRPQEDKVTHVKIDKGECYGSVILCEFPQTILQEKIGQWVRTLPDFVMKEVDKALAIALSIRITSKQADKEIKELEKEIELKNGSIEGLNTEIKNLKIENEKIMIRQRMNGDYDTSELQPIQPIQPLQPREVSVVPHDIQMIKMEHELEIYKQLYKELLAKSLK